MSSLYLIDGTYELFRHYFAVPKSQNAAGQEIGATRGVVRSLVALIREHEVSHLACAFDSEIRSFRNDMYEGYKDGSGVEEAILSQFGLVEQAVAALGVTVWPMVEFEADDALATAAALYAPLEQVEQVLLCSPDKDLAQCVDGQKVVLFDRKKKLVMEQADVEQKFGVAPASIPDYLGLVGDAADGIPGIPRWGAKSTAAVLRHYGHIEQIPAEGSQWEIKVRGAKGLAALLQEHYDDALLYRDLAVLRTDVPLQESFDELEWQGALPEQMREMSQVLGLEKWLKNVPQWQG